MLQVDLAVGPDQVRGRGALPRHRVGDARLQAGRERLGLEEHRARDDAGNQQTVQAVGDLTRQSEDPDEQLRGLLGVPGEDGADRSRVDGQESGDPPGEGAGSEFVGREGARGGLRRQPRQVLQVVAPRPGQARSVGAHGEDRGVQPRRVDAQDEREVGAGPRRVRAGGLGFGDDRRQPVDPEGGQLGVQARRRAGQRAEGDVRDDEQRTVAEVGEFAFDPVVLRVRAVEAARGASDGSGDAGRTACSGGSAR